MSASVKFSMGSVLNAISGSGAIISTIANRLGCAWWTAKKVCNRWQETREALSAEQEIVLDMCESTLLKSIQDKNTDDTKWYLTKKGKHRGYGEKVDISADIVYKVIPAKKEEDEA